MSEDKDPPYPTLPARQGHPAHDNQGQRSVRMRALAAIENHQFIGTITHSDSRP
jgi:hypothetical protein